MSVGRPKDTAPKDYMTTAEVAEKLGVTDGAVRARIHRGTIPVMPEEKAGRTPAGERRYYIPISWLEQELSQPPATRPQVEMVARELASEMVEAVKLNTYQVTEAIEMQKRDVKGAVEKQRVEIVGKLDEVLSNQARVLEALDEHLHHLQEASEAEQKHQERVREAEQRAVEHNEKMEAYLEEFGAFIREERDIQRERREQGLRERRSFWSRLFRD